MIGLSFRERLLASYHCQSTHGIDTHKFHGSFRLCFRLFAFPYSLMLISKDCFSKLPYRYFNEFLVLYSDFSDSRQISLFEISQLVRSLSHYSHHWIILAPQASILRWPQGFCYWLLCDDTLQGIVDGFHLHQWNHFQRKESTYPISRISLSRYHCISAGLKNPSSLS